MFFGGKMNGEGLVTLTPAAHNRYEKSSGVGMTKVNSLRTAKWSYPRTQVTKTLDLSRLFLNRDNSAIPIRHSL